MPPIISSRFTSSPNLEMEMNPQRRFFEIREAIRFPFGCGTKRDPRTDTCVENLREKWNSPGMAVAIVKTAGPVPVRKRPIL